MLKDAGADINARNKKGNTPLEIAKWNNKNKAVIEVLHDGGARESEKEGGFAKAAAALLGGCKSCTRIHERRDKRATCWE